jgi:hypothetical protein
VDGLLFDAVAMLPDGSGVRVDMDVRGWTSVLERPLVSLSLVPKDGALASDGTPFQPVTVQVPAGASPLAFSRVKKSFSSSGGPLAGIRIYGVGYSVRDEPDVIVWVLPDGSIEVGSDTLLSDTILDRLSREALSV